MYTKSRSELRATAVKLRENGYSYTYISKETNLSKSTLSEWLTEIPYVPNKTMLEVLKKARAASGAAKNKEKKLSFHTARLQAQADLGKISSRDIFMLGIGLYIGEGTKTHDIVRIINANPLIIKFAIRWFKEVYGLADENFKVRIHMYPDSNKEEVLKFWSTITGLKSKQFFTPYIDLRAKHIFKRGKLPYGTAHLTVKSNGKKEWGVFLSRRINALIEEVLK